MDLLATFERLSHGLLDPLQRADAETQLVAFRSRPDCLQLCQHFILHSADASAQFQAALAFRDVALQQWTQLSTEMQQALRGFLSNAILGQHAASNAVLRTLMASFAALLKVGWEPDRPESCKPLFLTVMGAASPGQHAGQQQAALQLLNVIVGEFSPATASALGRTWDFHEQCRASMERSYLREILLCAQRSLRASVTDCSGGPIDEGACFASLELLSSILSWDFRPIVSMRGGQSRPSVVSQEQLALSQEWYQLLISTDILHGLQQLLHMLKNSFSRTASAVRGLIVSLGSVCLQQSNVLKSNGGQGHVHISEQHSQLLMSALSTWTQPVEAVVRQAFSDSADELLDACRLFEAMAKVQGSSLWTSGKAGEAQVLSGVDRLTSVCIASGGCSEEQEGTWLWDACDQLIDAWAALIVNDSSWLTSQLSPLIRGSAESIFQAFTEAALKEARQGAADDEAEGEAAAEAGPDDDNQAHERFSRAATLGRACLPQSMSVIGALLQAKIDSLTSAASTDGICLMEEVCWLVEMAAHLIADSGDGEVPLPPAALSSTLADQPSEAVLVQMGHLLLGVTGFCFEERLLHLASPRMMEKSCWAVARWAETYLLPDQAIGPGLEQAFGRQGSGSQVAQYLLSLVLRLLWGDQWLGEVDLHRILVVRMLPALVKHDGTRDALLGTQEWQHHLIGKIAIQDKEVQRLDRNLIDPLVKLFCEALKSSKASDASWQGIIAILQKASGILVGLSQAGVSADCQASLPQILFEMNILCGAFKAGAPHMQPVLWNTFQATAGPILAIMDSLHSDTELVVFILKLAKCITDGSLAFLSDQDAGVLSQWILEILSRFNKYKAGQKSVVSSTSLRAEHAYDMYRAVKNIIKILRGFIQREVVSFEPAGSVQQPLDVPGVMLKAFRILLPCIDGEQLSFPKLARSYFQLLADLLEIFPERILQQSGSQAGGILQTLQCGLTANDIDVLQSSLDALGALMRVAASDPQIPGGDKQWLRTFAQAVLLRLVEEHRWQEFADHSADCLLPFIKADTPAFQSCFTELWMKSSQRELKRAEAAMSHLLTQASVQRTSTSASKREWRLAFGQFVTVLREVGRRC